MKCPLCLILLLCLAGSSLACLDFLDSCWEMKKIDPILPLLIQPLSYGESQSCCCTALCPYGDPCDCSKTYEPISCGCYKTYEPVTCGCKSYEPVACGSKTCEPFQSCSCTTCGCGCKESSGCRKKACNDREIHHFKKSIQNECDCISKCPCPDQSYEYGQSYCYPECCYSQNSYYPNVESQCLCTTQCQCGQSCPTEGTLIYVYAPQPSCSQCSGYGYY